MVSNTYQQSTVLATLHAEHSGQCSHRTIALCHSLHLRNSTDTPEYNTGTLHKSALPSANHSGSQSISALSHTA